MMDINIDYLDRVTGLWQAAYNGDVERLRELLNDPAIKDKINYQTNSQCGHSALFFACYGAANAETVKLLVEAGANPFQRDNIGRLPLHLAANTLDVEIIKYLLAIPGMDKFKLDKAEGTGQTTLHALFLPGSGVGRTAKAKDPKPAECLGQFLAPGMGSQGPLLIKDNLGISSMMVVKYLNLKDTFFTHPGVPKKSFGIYLNKNVSLPSNISEILKTDFYGRTEFSEAAFNSNETFKANKEIIRKCINEGADTMAINNQTGRNALQLACCGHSDGETVKLLLNAPSTRILDSFGKPNADHQGRTAWHFAANTGRIDTNTVLLEHPVIKANINTVDGLKRSALHAIAMDVSRSTLSNEEIANGETLTQREKVIDLYFANGINPSIVDANGMTALDIAVELKNTVVEARIRYNIEKKAALQSVAQGYGIGSTLTAFKQANEKNDEQSYTEVTGSLLKASLG